MTATRTHIAHGAFRLWHTFSSENLYTAQQGTTRNLMDYNGTNSELYKYQWDYIHNPQQGIVRWLVDDEESAVIKNEKVTGVWKTVNPPRMYDAKPKLTYNKIFIPDDEYIRRTHTLIQLVDGSKFLVSPLETSEVGYTYQIQLPEIDEWYTVYLDWFESDCLSCELEFIGNELTKKAGKVGKVVSRYVLPIEDIYILIEGENFDGEEASRVAAGGFILLEAVQVGKVYKLVKGAKILTKGGLKPTSKIVMHFGKELTNDVIIDLSCQFAINFITESVKHQDYSDDEILALAINNLDVKNAVVGGVINYSSLNKYEKATFNCAKDFLFALENSKGITLSSIDKGLSDCIIEFGATFVFSKLSQTPTMQTFFKEFDNEVSQTIILKKLKHFTSKGVYDGLETYIKTAFKKMNGN